MANFELISGADEQLLKDLLKEERYEILNSYEINVQAFYKYGKLDKEGNLKSPALTKNGIAIPGQVKLVSNFNRITDDIDVKIILNKELWDSLSVNQRKAVLDNLLHYIEIKEDRDGEPIPISETCDKVQLKLRKPDFYVEGFVEMINLHKSDYLPIQDAKHIVDLNV